jgi:alkaline phosphatase D
VNGTGAENHQEVCTVKPNATNAEKDTAKCDRDEGRVDVRFNDAAKSYFEWMPIRHQAGKMGVINVGNILQKISWGDMATIVTFDSRISHRSKDPTLNSNNWGAFFPFATVNKDVSQYRNESSPLKAEIMAIAKKVHAVLESDNFTMIGEDMSVLTSAFQESKNAGQPWQIWATGTALGRAVKGDYFAMSKLVKDAATAALVQNVTKAIYGADASTFFRALSAMAMTNVPWNRDDYSGFAAEQRKILAAFQNVSVNPIVLAGDLHDGYAWQLYKDGAVNGTPIAVNLVCPGVTSPVRVYLCIF